MSNSPGSEHGHVKTLMLAVIIWPRDLWCRSAPAFLYAIPAELVFPHCAQERGGRERRWGHRCTALYSASRGRRLPLLAWRNLAGVVPVAR